MTVKAYFLTFSLILAQVTLGGCESTKMVELDTPEHVAVLEQNREALRSTDHLPQTISLSLEQAMERGLEANLDGRVAALEAVAARGDVTVEALKALPMLEYTLARNGRNKQSASTSFSVATGQQSLEPSISTERYRTTRDLTVNWNMIDAATALMQASTARDREAISEERYEKVRQNIYRDVRSAYWRAWAGDKTAGDARGLITQAHGQINKIDQAAAQKLISGAEAHKRKAPYLQAITSLETLQNEGRLANIELKSLLNLPQSQKVVLTSALPKPTREFKKILSEDVEALEEVALHNRPEMRESFLEKNISIRDTRQQIVSTIPGAELFYGYSRDSNKFLSNNQWQHYSASLVQNITNLLTLPTRYSNAQKKVELSEARRITLAAAILAQLHISRHGLLHAQELANIAEKEKQAAQFESYAALKKQHTGHLAKGDALLMQMQAQEKTMDALQVMVQAQDSYAALINTLGLGLEDEARVTLAMKTLRKEVSS